MLYGMIGLYFVAPEMVQPRPIGTRLEARHHVKLVHCHVNFDILDAHQGLSNPGGNRGSDDPRRAFRDIVCRRCSVPEAMP